MVWTNDDGLRVKFGLDKAVHRNIGAYTNFGPVHQLEILVDHSELPAVADGQVILNDAFAIPAGALIEDVEVMVPTEAVDSAGDALTFCLGGIDQDRSSNADTDGFIVDATQAELNAGGENTAGWVGAYVGTTLSTSKLLTWEVNAAAATAGTFTIRIRWSVPPKNEDTLAWSKS